MMTLGKYRFEVFKPLSDAMVGIGFYVRQGRQWRTRYIFIGGRGFICFVGW